MLVVGGEVTYMREVIVLSVPTIKVFSIHQMNECHRTALDGGCLHSRSSIDHCCFSSLSTG